MMGSSLLAVPWAIKSSGLAMGFGIVVLMTIISYYTAYIIIDAFSKHNSTLPMLSFDTFYDQDLSEDHKRVGFGLEAKASMLNFNYNQYQKATNQKIINTTAEQILSGNDYNINSQIPYMPWTTFNFQGYRLENEKAAQDQKGKIYSLEMALNPSLQFNIENDRSSVEGQDDEWSYNLTFSHPPKNNKPTLLNGATSDEMFVKANMKIHIGFLSACSSPRKFCIFKK